MQARSWMRYNQGKTNFCQISDSTTSYGSYSGAVPNEKITWGKLDIKSPKYIVESDATIGAPLILAWCWDGEGVSNLTPLNASSIKRPCVPSPSGEGQGTSQATEC